MLDCLTRRIPATDLRFHISRRAAIWRTPIADRGERGEVPATFDFQKMHDLLTGADAEIEQGPDLKQVMTDDGPVNLVYQKTRFERFVKPYKENMEYATGRRRLFATTSGFVGLCPQEAEAGDLVVILFGGHVPYILRQSTTLESRAYRLVGEAFVHGVMYGEFVRLFQRQKQPSVKEDQFLVV